MCNDTDIMLKALEEIGTIIVKRSIEEGWFERLLNAFKRRHRILVLGSTGVGKTSFIKSLEALIPPTIHAMTRTEFVQHNSLKINDKPFDFVDTPGQIGHKELRMDAIRNVIKKPIDGVINIVCYGYHEHKTGKCEAFNGNYVKESYLKQHLELEVNHVGEWIGLIGDKHMVGRLITIISKADLWWDQKEDVTKYYLSGDYAKIVGHAKSVDHALKEYCSVFHRFYDKGSISSTIEDRDRIRMRTDILNVLLTSSQ